MSLLTRFTVYLYFLFFGVYAIFAQSSASKTGSFIRTGQSAQQYALGNTGVAHNANGTSFYYNPSSMLFSKKTSVIGLNAQLLSLDRRIYSFGFHKKVKTRAQISFGWIHATVNDLYEYSSEAVRGEELLFNMNAFYGSFGIRISETIGFSFTGKYLKESLNDYYLSDYNATGLALDLSLFSKISTKTNLAIVVRDITGSLKTNSDRVFETLARETAFELNQKLPKYIVVAVSTAELIPIEFISLMTDIKVLEDKTTSFHFGVEYSRFKNGRLRIGYNDNHITAGIGLDISTLNKQFILDYAYISSFYDEGASHIFSWTLDLTK